ncbi:DUF4400 domain-containing protein [Verminephrobacter eiseniae]|uniref:DUF4400 domain-containing protein n=1 Tax=Verminephrobacter eiseniae (strain EF01-2) TaxID=391735 RepID=A1WPA4_VEREI|nr:DUF4400 domain-containing protein [Verminephrobacter eiseniae]ABM59461.1 hypothetical protein Veis_3749 [Verminephrobacter eiseniae EF01-2]MCW5284984.1 DUF4400 domain-containing protein [Verminephrobacter eiseniae]MCW5302692.1 DUF4400 domain-containing protein [Verminephrobacter eiseniae]MCW8178249.1 DUF4400 domain-containing protein [Verminephrobacter eiseniae]MCW8188979.1 DUF4400 domain-containing protein [Verminephrobacter eiseniae]
MIEIKNQFARHSLLWIWVLPLALVFLTPAVVDREQMRVPREEVKTMLLLGQDAERVTRRADALYQSMFVATGAVGWTQKLLTSQGKSTDPVFFRNLARETRKYHDNLWNMVYRAVWRLAGLWPTFLALMLALALPALIDGLVVRAKKVDMFRSHNPVFFWSAGHLFVMVMGVFLVLPLLPFTISISILYGAVAAIALALWVTASNFQTGV